MGVQRNPDFLKIDFGNAKLPKNKLGKSQTFNWTIVLTNLNVKDSFICLLVTFLVYSTMDTQIPIPELIVNKYEEVCTKKSISDIIQHYRRT